MKVSTNLIAHNTHGLKESIPGQLRKRDELSKESGGVPEVFFFNKQPRMKNPG
jgi:hypothetical protein